MNQTPEDDADVLGAFGADPKRWPQDRRSETVKRLRADPTARHAWAEAVRLDMALDACRVDDGPARIEALGDSILARIGTREDDDDWSLRSVGWLQGLSVASIVGLLTVALLMFGMPLSGTTEAGLHGMLASTLWLGTY